MSLKGSNAQPVRSYDFLGILSQIFGLPENSLSGPRISKEFPLRSLDFQGIPSQVPINSTNLTGSSAQPVRS